MPGQAVRAVSGCRASSVPVWILGSSLYGAQLAAALGLPYAFASHFAPDYLLPALQIYRENFRPSDQLAAPYAMLGIGVFAADSDQRGAPAVHLAADAVRQSAPRPAIAAAAAGG